MTGEQQTCTPRADQVQIMYRLLSRSFRTDISYIPDLCDLYDLYDLYYVAHDAGWEPCNLRGLGHVSWVGYVPYRFCTAPQNGRLGSRLSICRRSICS